MINLSPPNLNLAHTVQFGKKKNWPHEGSGWKRKAIPPRSGETIKRDSSSETFTVKSIRESFLGTQYTLSDGLEWSEGSIFEHFSPA